MSFCLVHTLSFYEFALTGYIEKAPMTKNQEWPLAEHKQGADVLKLATVQELTHPHPHPQKWDRERTLPSWASGLEGSPKGQLTCSHVRSSHDLNITPSWSHRSNPVINTMLIAGEAFGRTPPSWISVLISLKKKKPEVWGSSSEIELVPTMRERQRHREKTETDTVTKGSTYRKGFSYSAGRPLGI